MILNVRYEETCIEFPPTMKDLKIGQLARTPTIDGYENDIWLRLEGFDGWLNLSDLFVWKKNEVDDNKFLDWPIELLKQNEIVELRNGN